MLFCTVVYVYYTSDNHLLLSSVTVNLSRLYFSVLYECANMVYLFLATYFQVYRVPDPPMAPGRARSIADHCRVDVNNDPLH